VDARITQEAATGIASFGNNGIIDTEKQAGGYPEYQTGISITDEDQDGMDDQWELANGLNPANPEDRNKKTDTGYTALEVYLNSLVNENIPHDFATGISEIRTSETFVRIQIEGDRLFLLSDAPLKEGHIYSCDGKKISTANLNGTTVISLNNIHPGFYLFKIISANNQVYTTHFLKK
ncbi:MAG: T9SS type A sorting domain-containing protein, partial [Bacteroidales bacterium]